MHLQKLRPLLLAYLLVIGFVLGLLVDRHPPAEPALPAAAGGGLFRHEGEERPAAVTPFWLELFQPSSELAWGLMEQAVPFFRAPPARTPGPLRIYGGSGRPAGLFQAVFPFLQGRPARGPALAARGGERTPGGAGGIRTQPVPPAQQLPALPPAQSPGPQPPAQGPQPQPPAPAPAPAASDGAGCERPPGVVPVAGGAPLVGIYHTHDYESYISEFPELLPRTQADWLNARIESKDPNRNIIRVGLEMAKALCRAGITVVHSPSVNSLPMGYDRAYQVSYTTAKYILDQYPTVKVLIDIHRDGADLDKGTTTVLVNGRPAARVMMVVGLGNTAQPNPNARQNLAWAEALDKALDARFPGLSRGVARRPYWFNQHLASGAALLEVGSPRNTMDEARHSARLVAQVLAELLAGGRYFR